MSKVILIINFFLIHNYLKLAKIVKNVFFLFVNILQKLLLIIPKLIIFKFNGIIY